VLNGGVLAAAQAASEDELRLALGLAGYTTGKGKADLKDSNIRPIEVFMCSVVRPWLRANRVMRHACTRARSAQIIMVASSLTRPHGKAQAPQEWLFMSGVLQAAQARRLDLTQAVDL